MKKTSVQALFPLINSTVNGFRGRWVEGYCPYGPWRHDNGASNPNAFGIEAHENQKSLFKCFSCGMGGDLMHLQATLSEYLRKNKLPGYQMGKALELISAELDEMEFDKDLPDYSEAAKPTDHVFPEKWLASFPAIELFPQALAYLASRGVKKPLYQALGLRYDPMQNRICFPYRNFKGELMGLQGRYAANKVPANTLRYYFYRHMGNLNMHAWMGEDQLDLDKPLVLVEGPFDYASTYRAYQNVAASFSAGLSFQKLSRLSDASSIVTFYDAGKGGDSARQRVHEYFGKKGTPVVDVIPENDGGDPGSMLDQHEVGYHLTNHVKLLYKFD